MWTIYVQIRQCFCFNSASDNARTLTWLIYSHRTAVWSLILHQLSHLEAYSDLVALTLSPWAAVLHIRQPHRPPPWLLSLTEVYLKARGFWSYCKILRVYMYFLYILYLCTAAIRGRPRGRGIVSLFTCVTMMGFHYTNLVPTACTLKQYVSCL